MKTSNAKMLRLIGAAGSAFVISIGVAHAGAFGLNEYNAISTGVASAGGAAGGAGIGSIAFNPATLTDLSGMWASQTFTFIDPTINVNSPVFGNTNDIGNGGRVVPAMQTSYQFNDRLWFGLTIDSPFGLATEINPSYYASFYGHTTQVTDIDATPMVGYKVNDWLSVGAGLQVNWFYARFGNYATPLVPGSEVSINGHDYNVGYKLGLTLKPFAGTEIGVGYRSQLRPELSGTLTNNIPLSGLSGIIPPSIQPMNADLVLPQQVNVGVRQVINDKFTLLGTYQWTDWSSFNRFIVNTDFGPALPLNFQYNNGWLIALGGEYKYNEQLTLRAGVNYENSPIDTANRAPRLPDADRFSLAGGASYQFTKQISADLAYMHVWVKDGAINLTSPANGQFDGVPYVGTAQANVNIVSLTLNYHLDAPPTIIAAKY
ncbi:OmpP1/FadL family transporter [Rhodoblastus sp.]|uniref:OmpP1/FadL family transporter n=1 Tax=Rhodoblastus sp. TaxID=1962975 RepID=UPI003F97FA08